MNFVRQAIGQPVTVTVGVILIVLAGLLALRRIPIQLTPNVESTIITVTTIWEGASPQEVEQNVIDKQEERLLGLANPHVARQSPCADSGNNQAWMASAVDPRPSLPRNFTAMIRTFQLTPTTPVPLSPTAPIVPATWVP